MNRHSPTREDLTLFERADLDDMLLQLALKLWAAKAQTAAPAKAAPVPKLNLPACSDTARRRVAALTLAQRRTLAGLLDRHTALLQDLARQLRQPVPCQASGGRESAN